MRENQTCFGKFIEYEGVKTDYLGVFTRKEEKLKKGDSGRINLTNH